MKVPFLDVGATYRDISTELDQAYHRVMESGWFILGPETTAFEQEFAAYCDCEEGIGVGSGLDALTVVLRAAGIGPGDSVIVPHHTFVATWSAVVEVGATPIGCPVDSYFNLDPKELKNVVREDTKAIIPVHLYGLPADMAGICEFANAHDLFVLEDAAQAHGATINGQAAGSFGDAAAFSFYPGKNLGAFGDGGMIVTRSAELAEQCRTIRNYGSKQKYVHQIHGINTRLDELQAALLRVKLKYLDAWNQRRREIADYYHDNLEGVTLPESPDGYESSWHLYVVRSDRRDAMMDHLKSKDIHTLVHYPIPPASQESMSHFDQHHQPTVELAQSIVSLPIGPHMTDEQVEYVADTVCHWATS